MKPPRFQALVQRSGSIVAACLAFASSALGDGNGAGLYFAVGLAGFLFAFGVSALWGERTRPRFNLLWLILVALLGAGIFASLGADTASAALARYACLGILIGLFIAHDHTLG